MGEIASIITKQNQTDTGRPGLKTASMRKQSNWTPGPLTAVTQIQHFDTTFLFVCFLCDLLLHVVFFLNTFTIYMGKAPRDQPILQVTRCSSLKQQRGQKVPRCFDCVRSSDECRFQGMFSPRLTLFHDV